MWYWSIGQHCTWTVGHKKHLIIFIWPTNNKYKESYWPKTDSLPTSVNTFKLHHLATHSTITWPNIGSVGTVPVLIRRAAVNLSWARAVSGSERFIGSLVHRIGSRIRCAREIKFNLVRCCGVHIVFELFILCTIYISTYCLKDVLLYFLTSFCP